MSVHRRACCVECESRPHVLDSRLLAMSFDEQVEWQGIICAAVSLTHEID